MSQLPLTTEPSGISYENVCNLFCFAEKNLKKIEHLTGDLTIPAVNQLRYAGQHLVRVLKPGATGDLKSQLDQAEYHCKRAIYDSLEAGLIHCLDKFRQFQTDYRTTEIGPHFSGYLEVCETATNATSLIDTSDPDLNREDFFRELEKSLDELSKIDKKLPIVREELNKVIRKERKNSRMVVWGIVGTFLSIVVAIVITK